MSGLLTGIGVEELSDTNIQVYNRPNINIPVTWTFHASLHEAPNSPALQTASVPGTGGPFTAYAGFAALTPSHTYWIRYYIEDDTNTVVAEAGRWLTTYPAGSVVQNNVDNPSFTECGTPYGPLQDRVQIRNNNGNRVSYYVGPTNHGGEPG